MWVIAKFNSKQQQLFKEELKKILGRDAKFYSPKIKIQKFLKGKKRFIDKFILENYLICFSSKFEDEKQIFKLKYIKGLSYFLKGYKGSQNEIIKFLNYCKSYEDINGYLKQEFFDFSSKKCKFISGPFTNMVFEILAKQKNKLKILVGNYTTTVSIKSGNLYRPV